MNFLRPWWTSPRTGAPVGGGTGLREEHGCTRYSDVMIWLFQSAPWRRMLMAPAPPHTPLKPDEQDFLDGLIRKHHGRPGMLLAILEAVQEKHPNHYLQAEVLEYLAARTGIPGSQICSVATFYALFNLRPQGEHSVCICRGTACHTRGSRTLLERVKLQLGLRGDGDDEGSAD